MASQGMSVEPGPRGESGEEFTAETSLPLGDHPQELPSRFQRGLTFRAARFVRVNTALQTVARGLGIPLQDHGPCFIEDPCQATEPGEEPPDEFVVDYRLVRRRRGRGGRLGCGQRIADQTPIMPHTFAIRGVLLLHVILCPGHQARRRKPLIRQYESRDSR
jgi:hypothetical protein